MSDRPKHESTHDPESTAEEPKTSADQRPPFTTQNAKGRAKRGSEFRDADLHDAPIEDPDDQIPD